MATEASTVEYIQDQLRSLSISTRKMFGEYALYCDHKVVGLICDDTLFIKITPPGKDFIQNDYREGFPYPGAKPWMEIDGDLLEDHEWLSTLVRITADYLPVSKKKS